MKAIVRNFVQHKLAWGITVMVLTQILGALPMLDFLPPNALKATSFALGCLLTVAKGREMFYEKSAELFEKEEIAEVTTTTTSNKEIK